MANATLASVFLNKSDSQSWKKLNRAHEFSNLRSAFWGKKVEDDARQWRESQSAVEDDDDNDIGPGCYVLNLGLELRCSKMWVRKDYIRIYDYCTRRHEEGPRYGREKARSVVITGQPGVGKSHWVTYAVRRRLGEQKPFLLYWGGNCFIFVKEGVFVNNIESVEARCFSPFLWAFVNGDSHLHGVPPTLLGHTNLYIIFTTFPERLRWKTLSKCTDHAVVVVNTWSLRETLLAAEKVHNFTGGQLDLAEAHFNKFGPVPRSCIDFVQEPAQLLEYESLCQDMVTKLTCESLRNFVLDGVVLDLRGGSHVIFLVRRIELEDVHGVYVEPISADVAMRLMTRINELQLLERIDLYCSFASLDESRAIAGLVYESLGQTILQEGVTLTLKPMIKTYAWPTLFHWKAQGEDSEQTSNSMDLDNSDITVSLPPNAAIEYEDMQTPIQPNCLYVPKARNHVAPNYFFQLDLNLYILQFTVANIHGIKQGIEECFVGQENIPPKTCWRFVFITPPGCEVDIKATSDEVEHSLEGVTLYSAHLAIEDSD